MVWSYHLRRKCEGSSQNSLRSISYFGSIWELHVLDLKIKVFGRKKPIYIFPWTRDSQCQNSANSLAGNTQNAPQNFSPICLPKPKSFEFLKKSSLWMSIVRGFYHDVSSCEKNWERICRPREKFRPTHSVQNSISIKLD